MAFVGKIINLILCSLMLITTVEPTVIEGKKIIDERISTIKENTVEEKDENKKIQEKINLRAVLPKVDNIAYACEEIDKSNCDLSKDTIDKALIPMDRVDYKIDALTHEIILYIDSSQKINDFKLMVNSGLDNYTLEGTINEAILVGANYEILDAAEYIYTFKTGSLIDQGLPKEGIYNINFEIDGIPFQIINEAGLSLTGFGIEVPKIDASDNVLLGDGVNEDTDIDGVSVMDVSIPSTVNESTIESGKPAYGVYELESIGSEYEMFNEIDGTNKDDEWTEKDLTITKYDHVIRHLDYDYKQIDNIDATVTNEASAMALDKDGGFSSDTTGDGVADKNDGFDPIGISKSNHPFEGTYDGGKTDGFVLDKIYMFTDIEIIGIFAAISGGEIHNFDITNVSFLISIIVDEAKIGILVGETVTTTIDNVSTSGELILAGMGNHVTTAGGIAGMMETSIIENTTSAVNIRGQIEVSRIGGIVGIESDGSRIEFVEYTGSINLEIKGETEQTNRENIIGSIVGTQLGAVVLDAHSTASLDVTFTIGAKNNNHNAKIGGLVGSLGETGKNKELLANSYFKGTIDFASPDIDSQRTLIGGLVGYNLGEIKNNYTYGTINVRANAAIQVGGLTGISADNSHIVNNYSNSNIEVVSQKQYDKSNYVHMLGGISASLGDTAKVENNYVLGNLVDKPNHKSGSSDSYLGGILGTQPIGHVGTTIVQNNYTAANLTLTPQGSKAGMHMGTISGANQDTIRDNYGYGAATYTLNGVTDKYEDSPLIQYPQSGATASGNKYVGLGDITDPLWWKDTLTFNNKDIDGSDSSLADNDDTNHWVIDDQINNWFYPHVNRIVEKVETPGDGWTTEGTGKVPEQENIELPKLALTATIEDFKINSMNLDLFIKYSVESARIIKEKANWQVVDDSNNVVLEQEVTLYLGTTETLHVPNAKTALGQIEPDNDYTIRLAVGKSTVPGSDFIIHTPKINSIDDDYTTIEDNYALIGDGVNSDTDVDDKFASSVVSPSVVSDIYGIFEAESIGYESVNPGKANWGTEDLTLIKYDHVIRPIDGHYLMENNIEASVTTVVGIDDILGGFGSDGFRPIGQKIITGNGDDSLAFSGIIDGNNNNISNIFIEQTTNNKVGIVSINDRIIKNLGIESGSITGLSKVSTIAAVNNGKIYNSYSKADIESKGSGSSAAAGITGHNHGIVANSYATGNITNYVETAFDVGGLVATNFPTGKVTNSYATGNVISYGKKNVGGLVGDNHSGLIENSYATGNVSGSASYVGGLAGVNHTYDGGTAKIKNSFSTGNVTSTGSLVHALVGNNTGGNGMITNSYVPDTVTVNGSAPTNISTGGTITGGGIIKVSKFSDSTWMKDTLLFNNYDVDTHNGIFDDQEHWDLSYSDLGQYPHLMEVKEKDESTAPEGDGFESIGSGEIPNQEDKSLPTIKMQENDENLEENILKLKKDNNNTLNTIDVSNNQKISNNKNSFDNNDDIDETDLVEDEDFEVEEDE